MLCPIVRVLDGLDEFDVSTTGYGYGLKRFAMNGIDCKEIDRIDKESCVLDKYCPDLIITSAASNPFFDMSEKCLWRIAREQGIPTVAFLDQWQNYAIRFSGLTENERLAYLPDIINCIDDYGLLEMKSAGFSEDILVTLGHPYLSSLADVYSEIDPEAIKNMVLVTKLPVDLFVSESIFEYYGKGRGYDQYDVLRFFLEFFRKEQSFEPRAAVIKLHPKDDIAKFRATLNKYSDTNIKVIQDELSPIECIAISDRVFGMTSIMLIEAYVLGKEVLSLQPGLKTEDQFVLSRRGLTNTVLSYDTDTADIPGMLKKNDNRFSVPFQTETFLTLVRQRLHHRRTIR